jgi:hypothetical protein
MLRRSINCVECGSLLRSWATGLVYGGSPDSQEYILTVREKDGAESTPLSLHADGILDKLGRLVLGQSTEEENGGGDDDDMGGIFTRPLTDEEKTTWGKHLEL